MSGLSGVRLQHWSTTWQYMEGLGRLALPGSRGSVVSILDVQTLVLSSIPVVGSLCLQPESLTKTSQYVFLSMFSTYDV